MAAPVDLELKTSMLVSPNSAQGLIAAVYDGLAQSCQDSETAAPFLSGRAILTPKMVDVNSINNTVLAMMPGEVM